MKSLHFDPSFQPAILAMRSFVKEVNASKNPGKLLLALERNQGYINRYELPVFADGVADEKNFAFVERYLKTILWVVGGYRIFVSGSPVLAKKIKQAYAKGGLREFEYDFMSRVYEREMEVVELPLEKMPKENLCSIPYGGHLKGKRIGFDAGGSDRKVSAVVDGEVLYSEETIWFPKTQSDPQYHFDGIYASMKTAVEKMGGDVDAIGISSAGVYIENKAMVASLFRKVSEEDYQAHVKYIYRDVVAKLEQELGHPIPYVVANDGDVTALAGALDLQSNEVLGIAMGTSEAVGYVDSNGNLTGWLSELAFAPVDFNPNAPREDWSGDYGVGSRYFSQDAVIRLALAAGIDLNSSLSPAEKLKYVQTLLEQGDERVRFIFEDIGTYLGYELAYYAQFYAIKHVLLLGRVTSGKGGDILIETARKVLYEEFPEYQNIVLSMPSEYVRRVGQSIAAASLPEGRL